MLYHVTWGDLYGLHIFDMAFVFLFLLFPRLGMGDMLCVRVKGRMGKQGLCEEAFSKFVEFTNCIDGEDGE